MHKRRVNAVRHYLLICRQLTYEIAETYGEMLDIKMAIVEEQQTTPSPHAVRKINLLCAECIRNFELFLDSFKTANKFHSDNVRPVLIAYFYMGCMHLKVIDSNVRKRIECIQKSIDCYQLLVSYCENYPDVEPEPRAQDEVKKKWFELKLVAKKKTDERTKAGQTAGGPPPSPLDSQTERILDVIDCEFQAQFGL
ncbi:PREDICTED: KIF1-binding protein homolog [Priapulus caudatus]|uniref:KIF-binding protein n=1 Tax=Priapulus caudatus TaxID=37621 RepID=A0ABM1DRR5_PRICU|nr:PREDICTED: KIF1-binding protein homolog [Priapulus caudatus]